MVIDHLSGRVVWAGKERKAKTLLRFFRKLGPQRAAELEAVSMDMWEPYITVVGKKAPQARVIFDRFHIVKHLNEAVDKTRRELVRELKGTARRNLKNTKFPLLKAKHNRSAKDKRVLREQVRANRRLYRAMLLRDDFMDLYTYKTETWAKKFLSGKLGFRDELLQDARVLDQVLSLVYLNCGGLTLERRRSLMITGL